MAILKVAVMGHPVLRDDSEKVPKKAIGTPEFQGFLDSLEETMFEYDGVGLAAPQVHTNLRILAMIPLDKRENQENAEVPAPWILINPEITVLDQAPFGMWEGCLSVPGLRGYVERPRKIKVQALDRQGEKFERVLEDFPATIFQHELDHLNGVLFVDRLKDPKKFAFNDEYARFLAPRDKEKSPDTGAKEN